ncbi:undecaprenyl-diphosphate phosphatase [Aureibacillus halotolerans]|uniref:Undecaprenyl-diphosphatase n=1 Tax=Aureibacillus halotolerans TaxID=1508390 RepID=A0A4R6U848_9BACI|nr:undecaprenyl-diphosphate phosphatase [Aureibacillus halotolerans]TDQ41976.1 undecaprenyl-diphosphatase [Aureibacillus halotolerans]
MLWEMFVAIVLGIVEGIAEFAPISSTGHMVLVDDLWLHSKELYSKEVANTFKIVIQLGSILAVIIVFRDRFKELLFLSPKSDHRLQGRLRLGHVIVGIIPIALFGYFLVDLIDERLFEVRTVLVGLVLGSILLLIADRFSKLSPGAVTIDQMTYRQAFFIGLFQCFALWPGFSRSGVSIAGGVLVGLSHRAASDYTFILAVPILAGASGLSLINNWSYFSLEALPFMTTGFVAAFIFSLVAIRFFLAIIHRIKLAPFAVYRLVLAGLIWIYLSI